MHNPLDDAGAPAIPPERRRGWIGSILAWLLTAEFEAWTLGLLLLGYGLPELLRQELSILNWREAQGTVLDTLTERIERKEGDLGPQLTVRVRYRYTVDGTAYEFSRVTTGDPVQFYTVQEAAEFRKRYPPGGQTKVLYSPYNPSEATLIAERGSRLWVVLGFGSLFLLIAIFHRWRHHRREVARADGDIPLDG